jgi:hypothetical protein
MGDDADTEAAGNIIITRLQTGVASCVGGCRLGKGGGGGRGFGENEGHMGLGRERVNPISFVKNADPFQDRHPGRQRELPKLVELPKSERTASTPTRGEFAPLLRDVGTHPLSRHSSLFERSVSEIISPQSRRTLFQGGGGGGGGLNGDFGDEVRLATASGRGVFAYLEDECTISDTCMYAYCIHIHMYTYIHVYVFICVSTYVCRCVCVCVCV